MRTSTGTAHARAGLLGNPGDGYEGKAIAIIIRNFTATVTLEESDHFEYVPADADTRVFPNLQGAIDALRDQGCYGGLRLIKAAIKRFAHRMDAHGGLPTAGAARFRVSYASDIPRQVGLSGSSAIVIATLRALSAWFGVAIPPHELAEIALAAELEELSIAAGPMDRVIQSYEGVMLMNFKLPRTAESYRRLDPAILPPLFMAYDPHTGEVSGKIHNDVKTRWMRGDPDVREAIAVFPRLVDEGIAALERGDHAKFRELMNTNFDTRAKIWKLSERDHEMVAIGRRFGAGTKFAGSGGAVIGALPEEDVRGEVERAYEAAGFKIIRPVIEQPRAISPEDRRS